MHGNNMSKPSQLHHRHHHLHHHINNFSSPSSSLLLPPSSSFTSHMAQHHPQAWLWQPPVNLHHHYQQLYHGPGEAAALCEREHMFEKPLTPSDVGKLNRLVIPKQHAEKYFPLDGDSGEKGLLLSFEDDSGKPWQFRYSYWASSQSYVLTKGWSRFVKEKHLDAGDVVLFERPRFGGGDRLFIGCRHRGSASESPPPPPPAVSAAAPAPAQWSGMYYAAPCPCPTSSGSWYSPVQRDSSLHGGDPRDEAEEQRESVAPANSKRLRLFGVNLDCWPEPDPGPWPRPPRGS